MQIIDVAFDGGKGDLNINLAKGVLEVKVLEKNESFPSQLQVNVPLDSLVKKLIDQAPNIFVKWALRIGLAFMDAA